ncbi:hypothetical protein [Brucella sp. 09RB8471]|uniref:hypothetical protein n=1 Tax=Brucella sp. 09RB8471 TaxID=1149952 RepID=UPI000972A92F|nr:hypothetical protein [Brucella sp. 09RB8471]APX68907.1 hypothetical protein BKD03_05915 [Brucella sp. 09RB8471]
MDLRLLAAGAIIDIGIFSLVINLLLLISPLYMLQVYDRVLVSGSLSTLLYLTIAAVGGLAFLASLKLFVPSIRNGSQRIWTGGWARAPSGLPSTVRVPRAAISSLCAI